MIPYQKHSETSLNGSLIGRLQEQEMEVYCHVSLTGERGATGKEVANFLRIPTASSSGRLRSLGNLGLLVKTIEMRNGGNVWKLPEYVPVSQRAPQKRDKVNEVKIALNEARKQGLSLDALTLINKIQQIIK
jgi:hypothetical protein